MRGEEGQEGRVGGTERWRGANKGEGGMVRGEAVKVSGGGSDGSSGGVVGWWSV